MKITPSGASNVYKSVLEQKKEPVSKSKKAPEKVDSIKISGASQEKTTAQLVESLKSQIMNDVKAGIDSHQLEDLKREVASGNYDVNPGDIIHKIMGDNA